MRWSKAALSERLDNIHDLPSADRSPCSHIEARTLARKIEGDDFQWITPSKFDPAAKGLAERNPAAGTTRMRWHASDQEREQIIRQLRDADLQLGYGAHIQDFYESGGDDAWVDERLDAIEAEGNLFDIPFMPTDGPGYTYNREYTELEDDQRRIEEHRARPTHVNSRQAKAMGIISDRDPTPTYEEIMKARAVKAARDAIDEQAQKVQDRRDRLEFVRNTAAKALVATVLLGAAALVAGVFGVLAMVAFDYFYANPGFALYLVIVFMAAMLLGFLFAGAMRR